MSWEVRFFFSFRICFPDYCMMINVVFCCRIKLCSTSYILLEEILKFLQVVTNCGFHYLNGNRETECGVPYKNKITNISLKARRETWKEVKYEISSCLSGITNVLSVFSNASARFQIPPVV